MVDSTWASTVASVDRMPLFQIFMDAWQKGLASLVQKSAYDGGILSGFVGNAFDYISITGDNNDLAYIPMIMHRFATFFFHGPSNARAFGKLMEPYPENRSQIYAYSFDQSASDRLSRLVKFWTTHLR